MFKEKKIGDIMLSLQDYLAVPAEAGFREIVTTLKKALVPGGGNPVKVDDTVLVYDNGLVAGFIGLEEVLGAIEPQFLKGGTYRGWTVNREWAIPVFWEGLFTDRCIEATDKKARDIMKPAEFHVEAEDPLIKAVYGMTKHSTSHVPVVRDGLAVGVVRSRELFLEVSALVSTAGAPVYTLEKAPAAGKTAASAR
ncbi:MAG: CBS domain-containing protein [Peptococcaceae bacterium]|nr:CBS domain-containing protein [Peptococcaceae bacterium]